MTTISAGRDCRSTSTPNRPEPATPRRRHAAAMSAMFIAVGHCGPAIFRFKSRDKQP
ncbi:Uncharacterised protein [Bordetella pertussis]|nr:Uncharacterised protein [Bordetella pertussis]CFP59807.1 Uncharacterised protein [Bordetella pertussis]